MTTRGATSSSADAKTVRPPLSAVVTHAATLPLDLPRRAAAPPPVANVPVADVPVRDPAPPASAVGAAAVPATDAATIVQDPPQPAAAPARESAAAVPRTETALPESGAAQPAENPSKNPPKPLVTIASLFTPDPTKEEPRRAARPVETPNECLVAEICIDDYLWSLYERAPKIDTNKVVEHFKVKVKGKKGKTKTVTKTTVKYVVGDFTWKDPIAAQKAGMSLKDYVIGGMDRSFKLKLFRALQAVEEAGLQPGITSAFRDNYRQSIATGKTAASDSSYHGGSRRGGYGHGLAVDLVSVKGETRMQRYASSDEMWKWIDAREKDLGVGRPYLDRDPPHIGPIDGKEFTDKRGGRSAVQVAAASAAKKKHAQAKRADAKKRLAEKSETKKRVAARNHAGATKRAKPTRSAKTASTQH